MSEQDRAARLLANLKMETISDDLRKLKTKQPMVPKVAIRIQKLEQERKEIRDKFLKLVWSQECVSSSAEAETTKT